MDTSSNQDYQKFLDVAIEAAQEAGKVIREGFGQKHHIDKKGRIDVVTEVDKKSEEIIFSFIRKHFPEHSILGEEEGQVTGQSNRSRWIVDPIDGTTNFAAGYPFFAISIAYEEDGQVRAGLVYDPYHDELFKAIKGGGAFLNDQPIHVSHQTDLIDSLLVTGFPYNVSSSPDIHLGLFRDLILKARGVRRDGSAALDLCYIACGRFDGYWELGLSPWDVAAGILIVHEAGGLVTDFLGKPHNILYRDLIASNGRLHLDLLKAAEPYLEALHHSPYWIEAGERIDHATYKR
ncbi:MAG: inositol monophosphatase [bacterium]|nr:inositol monophosphatase [bacterium]